MIALMVAANAALEGGEAARASPSAAWVVTRLGTLGGRETSARAINGRGQVVGVSQTAAGGSHAFLWHRGRMLDLGALPGRPFSEAVAINERGEVVGVSQRKPFDSFAADTGQGGAHAFLWRNGKMVDLGALPGRPFSEAVAINERGEVIGNSWGPKRWLSKRRAFVWRNGRMTGLGSLGGPNTEAVAINRRGDVIGTSDTVARDPTSSSGFFWHRGQMTDIDPGGIGGRLYPESINERGQVIGWLQLDHYGGETGGFVWQAGRIRSLSRVRGVKISGPNAINDRGQILVGPFVWEDGRTVVVPNTPFHINNRGHVVGVRLVHGRERAYFWQDGRTTQLPALPGHKTTAAWKINERDQILGTSERVAVVWTKPRR